MPAAPGLTPKITRENIATELKRTGFKRPKTKWDTRVEIEWFRFVKEDKWIGLFHRKYPWGTKFYLCLLPCLPFIWRVVRRPAKKQAPARYHPSLTLHFWPCYCQQCGWRGLSAECEGGNPIADTGDFSDIECPKCGHLGIEDDQFVQLVA